MMQIFTSATAQRSFINRAIAIAVAICFTLPIATGAAEIVAVGASVTLVVTADGSPAPTFRWWKNGAAIAGATDSILSIKNATLGDTGSYRVVATNEVGSAESPDFTLTVTMSVTPEKPASGNTPPVIVAQPGPNRTATAGGSVTFVVAASGTPAPGYQWQKNLLAIAGATNATLTLNSVTTNDSGSYTLVATNVVGAATSNAAMLTVNTVAGGGDIVTGLVAHWKLDETGGVMAADASGQGYTATLVNGPTWGAGRVSGAIQLDGGNDYVQLPAAPFGNYPTAGSSTNYQRTFAVWFKTTGSGVILGQTDVGTPVGANPTGYVPALYVDTAGRLRGSMFWHGSSETQTVSANPCNDGAWHHVVNTYANGTETLYIDGVSVGSQSVSEYSYNPSYAYYLGTGFTTGWPLGSGGWSYFSGSLDEVRLYDRALAAADVAALYAYAGSVNVAPQITLPPVGQTVNAGVNVTLAVISPLDLANTGGSGVSMPSALSFASDARIVSFSVHNKTNIGGKGMIVGFVINGHATLSLDGMELPLGADNLPESAGDSAALKALTTGAYTVQLGGDDAASAVASIQVHATADTNPSKLINLLVRTSVDAEADAACLGFVISGSEARRVLIRAVGPTLGAFGHSDVLADPQLELFRGADRIGRNDDWGGAQALTSAFAQVGAFAFNGAGSRDAALLVTLEPGVYRVVASGVGGSIGLVLVEIYDVP